MKRKRSLCILGFIVLAVLLLGVFAVLYAAYVYDPPEDRAFQSPYLDTVSSQYVKTDAFRFHYRHEGWGEPVVLIHGAATWLYSYRDNLPALAEHYSVYALDMPGHGYTDVLMENPTFDLDMMSEAILQFLDALEIPSAHLVGHSSGGGWVIHFASQHPARAKKLVLIDSNGPVHPVSLTFRLFRIPLIGELFSNFFTVDDLRKGLEDAFFDKTLVTETMIQEIRAPLTFHMNRRAQRLCIRNTDYRVTEREMQAIENPTLVIWGEQDQYLDPRLANVFRETMPDARVVLISNCGHSAHEEKPDTVNRLIISFLNGDPTTM